jgi:GntR family transcriptional repressor for pyruvate dehydrogenase complex
LETVFEKIGKDITLSKEIEQKIEQAILEKKFKPGEKLPTENALCEMFGVSRTALREALQMLSSRGLIYVKKGSGIYVEDYSASNVIRPMNIYLQLNLDRNYLKYIIEVRKMLEPQIARLAARNRVEKDVLALKNNLDELDQCKNSDYKKEGNLDRDFHMLIARASGNPMIPLIVDPIFQLMPKIKLLVYAEVEKAKSAALDYHALLYDKIKDQDEQGAYDIMVEHLKIAEEHSAMIAEKL